VVAYEICPEEPDGGLLVHAGLARLGRMLDLVNLGKVLPDAGELLEDGVFPSVYAVQTQGSCDG